MRTVRQNVLMRACFVMCATSAVAETTLDPDHRDAYGANIGWINAAGDVEGGAVVGQAFCSGSLYSGNCGWIHLGDGSPADGRAYANSTAADYGVNHDGLGNLSGCAYGANIGWIAFEQTHGKPKVDLSTGILSGSVYGANVGWIALNTAQGCVRTLTLDAGPDDDADGIPDAWELRHSRSLAVFADGGADWDCDGAADAAEYRADTDPANPTDRLRITAFEVAGTTNRVSWPARPTRQYALQRAPALSNGTVWAEGPSSIPASESEMTETVPDAADTVRFYRVRADLPLAQ